MREDIKLMLHAYLYSFDVNSLFHGHYVMRLFLSSFYSKESLPLNDPYKTVNAYKKGGILYTPTIPILCFVDKQTGRPYHQLNENIVTAKNIYS